MNLFRYLCKGCGALYNDRHEHGMSKLVHRGLANSDDASPLPTPKCVPYHDYVIFEPCGHCCPDVFASCRACKLGFPNSERGPGRPTGLACFCHYCVNEAALPRLGAGRTDELLAEKKELSEFDVFLCHNAADKPEVKQIGAELRERGISPWLDEWEIRSGQSWLRVLEQRLNDIKTAAIFVGENGVARWYRAEIDILVKRFVEKGSPTIPVILASTESSPVIPLFLQTVQWVDFRKTDPDPMDSLESLITGLRRG
jgi:hypothetical protein